MSTWANVVKKNITYVGPPPGFTLVPYCLCEHCQRQNAIHQSFQFTLKAKPNIEKILQAHNIHYRLIISQKQFTVDFFVCKKLQTKFHFLNYLKKIDFTS